VSFMRFLGGRSGEPASADATPPAVLSAETAAVRHIVARLAALPPEKARLLAGMAYVLARAAYADLEISDAETAAMEQELTASGLDQSQAVLVAEMAKLQETTGGGTSDYLVTREFRELSTMEQRLMVLRACFRVTAADDAISGTESATLDEIASELDIEREDLHTIRAEFADKFSARFGFVGPSSGQG
jgi:uncharacterized tellurite resistance protein B-like protein